jgi:hypothetical protein
MSRRAANCRMGGAQRYPSMPAACGDGFRFALPILRKHAFAFSRRRSPEVCISFALYENRGRREDRVLAAPAVSRAVCAKQKCTRAYRQLEHPGLPCAMALRLTSCSPRRTALLPPSPALLIASLAPAPRRPNHTTSPYASCAYVSRAFSVHRISPHVRDDRERPSIG